MRLPLKSSAVTSCSFPSLRSSLVPRSKHRQRTWATRTPGDHQSPSAVVPSAGTMEISLAKEEPLPYAGLVREGNRIAPVTGGSPKVLALYTKAHGQCRECKARLITQMFHSLRQQIAFRRLRGPAPFLHPFGSLTHTKPPFSYEPIRPAAFQAQPTSPMAAMMARSSATQELAPVPPAWRKAARHFDRASASAAKAASA